MKNRNFMWLLWLCVMTYFRYR